MRKTLFFLSIISFAGFSACNSPSGDAAGEGDNTEYQEEMAEENSLEISDNYERDGVKIYPKGASVNFPGASLRLKAPGQEVMNTADVNFNFEVADFELGKVSSDAQGNGLANSDKGQHIHLIVDNEPYSAHYEPTFTKNMENGDHVVIAFLSRSYHESVKEKDAYKVFRVNNSGQATEGEDLSQPMLFYSRPKGEYKGADTQKILFDFYLHNAQLGENGHLVKLVINDSEPFYFNKWQPYIIEGLPMGENTFSIELVDQEGQRVGSDFNSVTRTFTLLQ